MRDLNSEVCVHGNAWILQYDWVLDIMMYANKILFS